MIAMSKIVNDTVASFKSELQSKQSLIDQTHAKLREKSALLASERRRQAAQQKKAMKRKLLRQEIANLRRGNEELRQKLIAESETGQTEFRTDIKIGEADAGLLIDPSKLPTLVPGQPIKFLPGQREYLDSLPSADVLEARVRAYQKNNARLEAETKSLLNQSTVLEDQMRRIVSICIGGPEEKIDDMLENLVAAVESERTEDLDVGRVREFLRKVEQRGAG